MSSWGTYALTYFLPILSHQPKTLTRSMVTINDPPKLMREWERQGDPSSLGDLAVLPVELLYDVLEKLDMRSVTRFSRVCTRGRSVVHSLPAYRNLMIHAPQALAALSQTEMISLYPASQLNAVLRTEQCATCPAYGPYLFLPTCERICWRCLRRNRTRRVITRKAARKVFALSRKQVRQLPTISTIPGAYGPSQTDYAHRYKLVSVSAVVELAVSVHGSLESLVEAVSDRIYRGGRGAEYRDLRKALKIAASPKCDSLLAPREHQDLFKPGPPDRYFGMASVPFPSLTPPDSVEYGLLCKGCHWMRYHQHLIPGDVLANLLPPGCTSEQVLPGLRRRAYSAINFLEHIGHCYGVDYLLKKWADEE